VANDNTMSQVGTFVTAPEPSAAVPVKLGFTGVPAAVATGLAPGQSLPTISLVFSNPSNTRFEFDVAVFLDPLNK
jgi:hypothetical protein